MKEITDIKEIQSIALGILKFIDKVCEENQIQYFLSSGTAIGAIRHKGFIPWDDDIDIMMTRDNYEKFISIMENIKNDKFKCLHFSKKFPNYFYRFAKVVDLTTELYEGDYIRNENMGVFIDIFPIDGFSNDYKKAIKKYQYYGVMMILSASKHFPKSNKGFLRNVCKFACYIYAKLLGWKHWTKKSEVLAKKHSLKDCEYAGMYEGYGEKELMPKSIYEHSIKVKFEDYEFPIMKDYDYYLTKIYGDYMTPPPKEKQVFPHTCKILKKD